MSAGRSENEQKISDLEKRVKDLEEHKDRTDNTVRGLKRRVDRMDKSTQVVIENHQDLEKIYQDAEHSRNFKEVSKDTARVVLQSISTLTGLPFPIPESTAESWRATNENYSATYTLSLCLLWWEFVPAFTAAVRFLTPNKSRSTRDANTNNWTRAPNHFVVILTFGMDSLVCQKALTGELGRFISGKTRAIREAGEANTFGIYLNKTEEERERKQQRANPGKGQKGNQGKGKGKGKGRAPAKGAAAARG